MDSGYMTMYNKYKLIGLGGNLIQYNLFKELKYRDKLTYIVQMNQTYDEIIESIKLNIKDINTPYIMSKWDNVN